MLVVAEVDFEKLNIESPIIDGYEDEYILDCWCDDCCCCDCNHYCMEVTHPEKYSYEINGKPVSKDEFDKKFKELHEKYEKNMTSVLNDYCAWMVDFNNMVKRLW